MLSAKAPFPLILIPGFPEASELFGKEAHADSQRGWWCPRQFAAGSPFCDFLSIGLSH